VRPTPDRVRETLFNWLQPVIEGARCLDLFAGSGALGLEAASRGASEVVLVDSEWTVVSCLRKQVESLGADTVRVLHQDALAYLTVKGRPFDVVFLDPPFQSQLLAACCERLEANTWLNQGAYIYLELDSRAQCPLLPSSWTLIRSSKASAVGYHLAWRRV
jgi:RNA methyltransferase, RsmD family